MTFQRLESLGLGLRQAEGELEADFELTSGQLVNPITRQFLTRVTFRLADEWLVPIAPAELMSCAPVSLASVHRAEEIEAQLVKSLDEQVFQLSRRSAELSALGLSPQVDSSTLQLSAELHRAGFQFVIAADARGNFQLQRTFKDSVELTQSGSHPFELSEFRERAALEGYLVALVSEQHSRPAQVASPQDSDSRAWVSFGEVAQRFGAGAVVPPRSTLEILIELRVAGRPYRFAAARVAGRTFRGLLAGASGRVWAERFELDQFPGVPALVSQLLSVPEEQVELLTPGGR